MTTCSPTACSPARPRSRSSSRTWRRTRPSGPRRSAKCRRATMRRIAREFVDHARVGETIEIEGQRLPYRPVAVSPRQDGQQRLGRLRVRVGAHDARGARRRTRSAGRHARHDGAPQPPGAGARRQRAAGPRRLHGVPAQPDRQGALVAESEHPQRVPDDGAARGQRPVEPGARARRTSRGCSWTRRRRGCRASRSPTCGSSTGPIPRSRSGTRPRSATRWRASRSWSPSPTRATRRTTMRTSCCPRRPTSRACS